MIVVAGLMAICGFIVGVIAGLLHGLLRWLWALLRSWRAGVRH